MFIDFADPKEVVDDLLIARSGSCFFSTDSTIIVIREDCSN